MPSDELRIERAEFYLVRVPLRFAVNHALASRRENVAGFVVLHGGQGRAGIGEFLPREYVTGETLADCLACLRQIARALKECPAEDPIPFLDALRVEARNHRGQLAALGALELALLDLWGKSVHRPAWQLIEPEGRAGDQALIYSAVYPLTSARARWALNLFYRSLLRMRHLKIKGTGDVEEDTAAAAAIRRAFPYPVEMRLDLNGSLPPPRAEEYFTRMLRHETRICWFEQPFPKHDWESAGRFQKQFGNRVVLCGDESICTLEDLERARAEGAFRAVNIRIGKSGGLLPALSIYRRAQEVGLETQLGCLVGESSVLGYAGLHLAAVAGQLRYREGCFGRYLLKWDPIQPSLTFSRHGRVGLDRLPAAGLVPPFDLERLRRRAIRSGCLEAAS